MYSFSHSSPAPDDRTSTTLAEDRKNKGHPARPYEG
jgi:hypothetical protein